jgi:DNA-binding NtrC family response regulator
MTMRLVQDVQSCDDDRAQKTISRTWWPPLVETLLGRKMLIAHESTTISATMADIFRNAGARVMEARDSSHASMLIAWGGYDLIFLDAAMPSAEENMQLIQRYDPFLPSRTIVLTGDVAGEHTETRLRSHYGAFFFQPSLMIDLVDLAATVLSVSEQCKAV